jgi:hypothetical protein
MYTIAGTKKLIALKKKVEQCKETEIAISIPPHLKSWNYPRVLRKEEFFIKGQLPNTLCPIKYGNKLVSDTTREPYEYYVDGKQFDQTMLDKFYHKVDYRWGAYAVYRLNDNVQTECKIKVKRSIYDRDEVLELLQRAYDFRKTDLEISNSHQNHVIQEAERRKDKNNELLHVLGDGK